MVPDPHDLRLLFDLATRRQDVAGGCWWRIAVWEGSAAPDDIRDALTLHGPDNGRVLGYDNDHGYHHRHPPAGGARKSNELPASPAGDRVPYSFTTCAQLVADFFADVDRHLASLGVLP